MYRPREREEKMFRMFPVALVATIALLGIPVGAQTVTLAQVEADTQSEALEWFQPDMNPQDFAQLEFLSRCVLGVSSPKCPRPVHPIPVEVAERVLVLLREAKEVHLQHGKKAFEAWLTMKNVAAEQEQDRVNLERASKFN